MAENIIAELPPGGPLEGGGVYRPHHVVNPSELPPFTVFDREAVGELIRLRNRVNALESQVLSLKLGAQSPAAGAHSEAISAAFTGGELSGPDYGHVTLDDIWKLLQAILAALPKGVGGAPNELPPPGNI
jgi:hypothetical protein